MLFLGILLLRHFSVAVSAQDEAGPSGNGSTATWLSPLTRGATKLLCDNYRTELEATIPSPLIDAHQVTRKQKDRWTRHTKGGAKEKVHGVLQ